MFGRPERAYWNRKFVVVVCGSAKPAASGKPTARGGAGAWESTNMSVLLESRNPPRARAAGGRGRGRALQVEPVPLSVRVMVPQPLVAQAAEPEPSAQEARTAPATRPVDSATAPTTQPADSGTAPTGRPTHPGTASAPQAAHPGAESAQPALAAASSVASAVARSLMEAQVAMAVQLQAGLTRLAALLGEAEQLTRQMQQQLASRAPGSDAAPVGGTAREPQPRG